MQDENCTKLTNYIFILRNKKAQKYLNNSDIT